MFIFRYCGLFVNTYSTPFPVILGIQCVKKKCTVLIADNLSKKMLFMSLQVDFPRNLAKSVTVE